MSDGTVEKVAHKLGIPWPSAEESQLRAAADAFDAAAGSLDAQREACSATVRSLSASNSGGGIEQFAAFWGRYDGAGGVMPATAQACRETAGALRAYAAQVEHTKASIRHKVEIAGAALVVGAVAAVFTLGASEAVAVAAAAALAEFAAAAGVALSVAATDIVATALVGAAFGVVESVAVDALVVQPLSVALGEQQGFSFSELARAGEFGAAGGLLAGGAFGALGRLGPMAAGVGARAPRLASSLDALTSFTGSTAGRMTSGAVVGAGVSEALAGGRADGFDVLFGALGGMAAPGLRRRPGLLEPGVTPGTAMSREPAYGPTRLVRDDNNFSALVNHRDVPKAHLQADGALVPANAGGATTLVDHVIGDNGLPLVKGNSPFISFKAPDNTGKSFGSNRMEVDLVQLQADVAAGLLPGTRVVPPVQVQAELQAALDAAVGRHVEVPMVETKAERQALMREPGFTGEDGERARALLAALRNTRRDDEWLVQGRIPARYLVGPFSTVQP